MSEKEKDWACLVQPGDHWVWQDGVLWYRDLSSLPVEAQRVHPIQRAIVKYVYGNHNRSPAVRRALEPLLLGIGADEWGLNLGAGDERLHPKVLNLDIFAGKEIDIVGTGATLPFRDFSLSLVVCQEVLEHVPCPSSVIAEVYRVLRPGGCFYFQVPFQIGFHPGPMDYWRFSCQGCEELLKAHDWAVEEVAPTQGHGTAFYRIGVEFFAVTASCIWNKLYIPVKGFSAILLYPVKLMDYLTRFSTEKDRIAAGYYVIARKGSDSRKEVRYSE